MAKALCDEPCRVEFTVQIDVDARSAPAAYRRLTRLLDAAARGCPRTKWTWETDDLSHITPVCSGIRRPVATQALCDVPPRRKQSR